MLTQPAEPSLFSDEHVLLPSLTANRCIGCLKLVWYILVSASFPYATTEINKIPSSITLSTDLKHMKLLLFVRAQNKQGIIIGYDSHWFTRFPCKNRSLWQRNSFQPNTCSFYTCFTFTK